MGFYQCMNPECPATFDSAAVRDAHERNCEYGKKPKKKDDKKKK